MEIKIAHVPSAAMEPQIVGDTIQLFWENKQKQRMQGRSAQFSMEATVQTTNEIVPVRDKILFPIIQQSISPEVRAYLKPGRIANHNHDLEQAAMSLVAEKDDLYHAVFAIADWVSTNIAYSLASEGQPAIQSASQVLNSRFGKCDEITALFVSMNRAVGIPCRFALGYSYTDNEILFKQRWGAHSWAEVHFPGVGWVPFDVTYGQFGYVDAGHIMLSASNDAEPSSVEFSASGREFELFGCEVDTIVMPRNVQPADMNIARSPAIDICFEAQAKEVGFGSACVVVATLINNRDHYVSMRLNLGKPNEIELLNGSDTSKNVLLNPREVREIPFFFKMDEQYKSGYRYEYTFSISSNLTSKQERAVVIVKEGAPLFYAKM
eukprot:scaffold691_cov248-Chaetoceros_neogracile.AAC.6